MAQDSDSASVETVVQLDLGAEQRSTLRRPRLGEREGAEHFAASHCIRVANGDGDSGESGDLFAIYHRLFIGDQIVEAILDLARDRPTNPARATAAFDQKRRRWETDGGFVETLSPQAVSAWLESPSHIVAEALFTGAGAGPHNDGIGRPVGSILYELPRGEWIVPTLLGEGDTIFDQVLHDEVMAAGPDSCVATDYLGILPQHAGKGLAGAVRQAGAMRCVDLNAGRPRKEQARFVVGWTFAIQGLWVLDPEEQVEFGSAIQLSELGQAELVNLLSLRTYLAGRKVPTRLLGKYCSAPPVPIQLSGRRYAFDMHWYCMVQRLEDYARVEVERWLIVP